MIAGAGVLRGILSRGFQGESAVGLAGIGLGLVRRFLFFGFILSFFLFHLVYRLHSGGNLVKMRNVAGNR